MFWYLFVPLVVIFDVTLIGETVRLYTVSLIPWIRMSSFTFTTEMRSVALGTSSNNKSLPSDTLSKLNTFSLTSTMSFNIKLVHAFALFLTRLNNYTYVVYLICRKMTSKSKKEGWSQRKPGQRGRGSYS